MSEIREDQLGQIPEIGDTIVFNPPKYKGLVIGMCVGFSPVGLPKVKCDLEDCSWGSMKWDMEQNGYYTPKTGFVCIKNNRVGYKIPEQINISTNFGNIQM